MSCPRSSTGRTESPSRSHCQRPETAKLQMQTQRCLEMVKPTDEQEVSPSPTADGSPLAKPVEPATIPVATHSTWKPLAWVAAPSKNHTWHLLKKSPKLCIKHLSCKKLENTNIKFTYWPVICPSVAYALFHVPEFCANLLSLPRSLTPFSEHSRGCHGVLLNHQPSSLLAGDTQPGFNQIQLHNSCTGP